MLRNHWYPVLEAASLRGGRGKNWHGFRFRSTPFVHSELRVIQKQDWRMIADMTPGATDGFPYVFVHSDKAIPS